MLELFDLYALRDQQCAHPQHAPAGPSGAGMKKVGGSSKRMTTTMASITMIKPPLRKDPEALAVAAA